MALDAVTLLTVALGLLNVAMWLTFYFYGDELAEKIAEWYIGDPE